MFKPVGRIIVRKDKIAGLFIPIGSNLPEGIYELRDIMGELTVHRIGMPNMNVDRYNGLDLNGLMYEMPNCAMTAEELEGIS